MLGLIISIVQWWAFFAGWFIVAWTLARFGLWVRAKFFTKGHDLLARYGEGSYALVTGSTGGIGGAYCEALARRGFNLVLVSRNLDKLNEQRDQLVKEFPKCKVEVYAFDMGAAGDEEGYLKMERELQMDISLIIANAGVLFKGKFADMTSTELSNMLNLNIYGTFLLASVFQKRLLDCSKIRE